MSKVKNKFVCSNCGYESAKFWGKCPNCNEWGTLEEVVISAQQLQNTAAKAAAKSVDIVPIDQVSESSGERILTGLKEFDRVLGGGLVFGSLVLVGGDPGIGKSTLLLQVCEKFAQSKEVFYVSGEESKGQIKIRANRLGVSSPNIKLISETDMDTIVQLVLDHQPDILIIDSIQTMSCGNVSYAPGSASQIKESTAALMRLAKEHGVTIFVIGHVTKEGALAGPKMLEHMVDTVLYFEGDKNLSYRLLRAVKNRFGSTNEIGVFDMVSEGLVEVDNPSKMFLEGRPENVPGSCVTCLIEGSRPILAEVQALVSKTVYPNPRRMSAGVDLNRMHLLTAVLEKRANFQLFNQDAYLNVIGGFRIDEPSADLAIAIAIASSLADFEIPSDLLVVGEIGLSGEIRAVSFLDKRISEAQKLGFQRIIVPGRNVLKQKYDGIEVIQVKSVSQAIHITRNLSNSSLNR
ncbi:MAG: DNA repair protein RadA [Clostridia bacterium]|nr:DNA repair protein RadA [Clostridia bacterium]